MKQLDVVETLAAQLHREYRAAEKAMNRKGTFAKRLRRKGVEVKSANLSLHDHGWSACSKQQYFLNRAKLVLSRAGNNDALTLGEAEEALQAQVLKRRLLVGLEA